MYIGTGKISCVNKILFDQKNHNLHVVKVNNVVLCAFDDKHFVLDHAIETLAFGHFRVTNQ